MILKIQSFTQSENCSEREEWTLFDNIESASVFYDEDAEATVVRCSFRGGNVVKFDVTGTAYLMSDTGKTVERIYAAAKDGQTSYETLHDAAISAMET